MKKIFAVMTLLLLTAGIVRAEALAVYSNIESYKTVYLSGYNWEASNKDSLQYVKIEKRYEDPAGKSENQGSYFMISAKTGGIKGKETIKFLNYKNGKVIEEFEQEVDVKPRKF